MEKLKKISAEYEILKDKAARELKEYLDSHNGEDLANEVENRNIPKWKQTESAYQLKEEAFIQVAKQIGIKKGLTDKELIVLISKEILRNGSMSINQFLLIRLMWEIGKERGNVFCLDTIVKLCRNILDAKTVGYKEEYYLESFLDIWHYDTDRLIPIDILEAIILLDPEGLDNRYGAMIKAVSYLTEHSETEKKKVLVKARNTPKYKKDKYYQEWID